MNTQIEILICIYWNFKNCQKALLGGQSLQYTVSNDRTDYNALNSMVRKHFSAFEEKLKEVAADSGC